MVPVLQSLTGLALIPLLVWAISENRSALPPRLAVKLVGAGLALQFALAVALLSMPWTRALFAALGDAVTALQAATDAGAQLMFGYLAGGPAPFQPAAPQHAFIVAFRVLPMILVLSAIVKLLYHWGVMQVIVRAFAAALERVFGTGGPLSTVAASSVVLGLVEAPLVIRPYLAGMGRGALFATMAVTMATIAGTVLALYASIIANAVPGSAGNLLAGSIINVPAALMLARLAVPDGFTGGPAEIVLDEDARTHSSMDAIARGATEGISVVAGVAAMLIVVVSLVALANMMLGAISGHLGYPVTLQGVLGWVAAPVALLIGIPASEAVTAGSLIGQKVVLNEFLAYLDLARLPADALTERSRLIVTYALCGFANLGSLGILIAALSAMAPERRSEIVQLAPKAMLIGFLSTMLSAAIVGVLHWP